MPEQSVVRSRRESTKPVRQTGLVDIVLGIVAIAAVGALGYFGFTLWSGQGTGPGAAVPPSPVIVSASLAPSEPWTDRDTSSCSRKGSAASQAPIPSDVMMANPSVTRGFANMATIIACTISSKADRFCDPAEKAALVAMINDYVSRIGLIVAGLNLEGAPMQLLSGMNGEIKAGAGVHDMIRDDTIGFMKIYNKDVRDGLRELVRDGVITVGDFGTIMGMGVPQMIKDMLDGVERTGSRCG